MIVDGYKLKYPGMWIFTPSSFYSMGVRGQSLEAARDEARHRLSQDKDLCAFMEAVDEDENWRYMMDLADRDEIELRRWRAKHLCAVVGGDT